jgi:phage tail-like protein
VSDRSKQSSYLDFLPAIYRPDPSHPEEVLGHFLLAFEHILSGCGQPDAPGMEELLAGIESPAGPPRLRGIQRYFDPGALAELHPAGDDVATQADGSTDAGALDRQCAPAAFLEWLAGWVALSLQDDWSEEQKRRMIAHAAHLYRRRGTPENMRRLLEIYTGNRSVTVKEFAELPNYFQVELSLGIVPIQTEPVPDAGSGGQPQQPTESIPPIPVLRQIVARQQQVARVIVEQEKPAHTVYQLRFSDIPTMQIGLRSTIGVDTWLGAPIASLYVPPPDETIQVGVRSTVGVDTAFGPVPQS